MTPYAPPQAPPALHAPAPSFAFDQQFSVQEALRKVAESGDVHSPFTQSLQSARHASLQPVDIRTSNGYIITLVRTLSKRPAEVTYAEQPNDLANTLSIDDPEERFKAHGITLESKRWRQMPIFDDHYGGGEKMYKYVGYYISKIKDSDLNKTMPPGTRVTPGGTTGSVTSAHQFSFQRNDPENYARYNELLKQAEAGVVMPGAYANVKQPDGTNKQVRKSIVLKSSAVLVYGLKKGVRSGVEDRPSQTTSYDDLEVDGAKKLAQLVESYGQGFDVNNFFVTLPRDVRIPNPKFPASPPRQIEFYVFGEKIGYEKPTGKDVAFLRTNQGQPCFDAQKGLYNLSIPPSFAKQFKEFRHEMLPASLGELDNPVDGKGGKPRKGWKAVEVPESIMDPTLVSPKGSVFDPDWHVGYMLRNHCVELANNLIENPHQEFVAVSSIGQGIVDVLGQRDSDHPFKQRRFGWLVRYKVANTQASYEAETKNKQRIQDGDLETDAEKYGWRNPKRQSRDFGNAAAPFFGVPGSLGNKWSLVHTNGMVNPREVPLHRSIPRLWHFVVERLATRDRLDPDFENIGSEGGQTLVEITIVPFPVYGAKPFTDICIRTHVWQRGYDKEIRAGRKACPTSIACPIGTGMDYGGTFTFKSKDGKPYVVIDENGKEDTISGIGHQQLVLVKDPSTVRYVLFTYLDENKVKKTEIREVWEWKIHAEQNSRYGHNLQMFSEISAKGRNGIINGETVGSGVVSFDGSDEEVTGPGFFMMHLAKCTNACTRFTAAGMYVKWGAHLRDWFEISKFTKKTVEGLTVDSTELDRAFFIMHGGVVKKAENFSAVPYDPKSHAGPKPVNNFGFGANLRRDPNSVIGRGQIIAHNHIVLLSRRYDLDSIRQHLNLQGTASMDEIIAELSKRKREAQAQRMVERNPALKDALITNIETLSAMLHRVGT